LSSPEFLILEAIGSKHVPVAEGKIRAKKGMQEVRIAALMY
jgi:hypothetical protein